MAVKATPKNNPWKQMYPVFLPKASGGEQNFVRVVVNGRPFQIPRGRQQMVPRPVYEVLARSETAKNVTECFDEAKRTEEKQR